MSAIHCFFCGGKDCKWENWKPWAEKTKTNAVDGLYSNWITDNILAMQRPSTRLIAEFQLTDKFRQLGVGSIFNLEEFGEHASCGDGIEVTSGFSYLPETWMDAGVFYYNFGWQDMNVPDFSHMLSIAQVMAYALEDGQKIAVHCHAGLGRTGLSIACYLVYGLNMESNKAIEIVRKQRPLSVQTRKQALFVQQFEEYIKPFKVYFPGICSRSATEYSSVELLSLESTLQNQRRFFHGSEQRDLRYVPKIVAAIVSRLRKLGASETLSAEDRAAHTSSILTAFASFDGIAAMTEPLIVLQAEINAGHWTALSTATNVDTLVQLLLYWVISLQTPLMSDLQLWELHERTTDTERLQAMDRGTLYTLNYIIDALRPATVTTPDPTEPALKNLSILITRHRDYIKHPYKPQLMYAKDVVPPLPGQWKGWGGGSAAHSRHSSNRPTPTTRPVTDTATAHQSFDLLPTVTAVLLFLYEKCTAGADGRPVCTDHPTPDPLPQTPDQELSQSQLLILGSQLSLTSTNIMQQQHPHQPPPLPFRPAQPLSPLQPPPLAPLTTPQPPTYWAKILLLMDKLFDDGDGIFTDEEARDLRRICMLKHDAVEIAYEAYGDGEGHTDAPLRERYARFVRAAKDLVGQIPVAPAVRDETII
ncbi:hypothetical protein PhCBS80983_g04880 [Powellomyces hirtus]|uniref:Protein-tyrosine-phosphatase n=1 Tax=Powellomyces hirtus TaxID=109895 RepID=A0A507DW63_9FUNG|nr:hypothetical protein PhCBS80983_g04880 [Powellomyces hirtus]